MSPEPSGEGDPALGPGADLAAWGAVLDALERDLTVAGGLAWSEPTGLGPVPRELVGRASRLLAAQRDRTATLEAERRQVLEHLGALRAVSATREPRGSVYLDASA
ncbi:hypothetical protein HUN58_16795 [Curtobacterium sp. Csp1]|uniref:hypothetical protein n=1 Tax=unclassified Curtobacterium TaxID=257496 RepID=UPI00159B008A|nr:MULTISPECIES: hypothetical protein [unclassified Curtobacterium]QKS14260.1 hypothetical protein HUN60_14820 [Curtobacterium sp. csp3]QKS21372.1 hypothetical protein HUN58_16795 [Curtobacterium sp. Csp1]